VQNHKEVSESKTILVICLDGKTTTTELQKLFKPYGRIVEVGIKEFVVDDGRNPVTATVTFTNSNAATMAILGRDGVDFHGRSIHVSLLRGEPNDF